MDLISHREEIFGNLPVMASVHAFDSEAEVGSKNGLGKVSAEVALIRRKIRMGEKLLIQPGITKNKDMQSNWC